MKARLKIKNFGPIDDLDIEISKFNILIGPHASGKSTVSKVLCIMHFFNPGKIFEASNEYPLESIARQLLYYRIENFLQKNTYWFFEDEIFLFELNDGKVLTRNKGTIKYKGIRTETYYFPAERVALPIIGESLFELNLAQSTLPGYFLEFGKDFTIARKNQNLFNIPILKVEFEYKNGTNTVVLRNNKSLLLEETSSAIQANLPLLVILQYPVKIASLFVIEELELHGFPTLQKELLYYVVDRMKHPQLNNAYVMLPTHSPYILGAANNLLSAAKVAKQNKNNNIEVDKIISRNSWINKDDFSAYFIADGTARSIVDEKTGLIHENELDGISEDLAGEFDALMDLYKPVNA